MNLRKFEDDEALKPLPRETEKTVKVFLDTYGKEIVKWFNYMQDSEKHPLNAVIPFLHCRQIGIEANIILDIHNTSKPSIIINPEIVVLDKKCIEKGIQLSDSFPHPTKEHVKRMFLAERATKVLLKYSEYTDEYTVMVNGSDEYEDSYAVLLQEVVDFSHGKMITRFEEIFEKEPESDTIEGESN